jgi:diadenosine tetraphosphate (Ap4A) HIT family hydrolase
VRRNYPRRPIDVQRYVERVREGARRGDCFICDIRDGRGDRGNVIVYEDDDHIVFLNLYPTVYGYVLLAPKVHREHVTGDLTVQEYIRLQTLLHRVAEAVRVETGAERIYLLSLGSKDGNSHVHWHVAPLPPGVPYEQQQFEALRAESGVLDIPDDDRNAYAARLRARIMGT